MSEEVNNPGEAQESFTPEELAANPAAKARNADVNLDLVLDVPVNVSLRVGTTEIPIRELVRLVEGSVIALDRDSSQAMDVLVNGTLIAHGEIVVVDEKFGVRLTDIVSPVDRIQTIN
jgi:flagellar motor switch protein FliN/FliY